MSKNLSIRTNRSVPNLNNEQIDKHTRIKSASIINNRINIQQNQEHLENLNQIADQTDEHLRQALEHAAIRHEQLDQLHVRSQEMLNKNENLVFGITNYRKTQQRDIFWRRIQYIAFGTITLGIIILLIILSLTTKHTNSSPQIIDIRQSKTGFSKQSQHNLPSNLILSTSRRRKRKQFN